MLLLGLDTATLTLSAALVERGAEGDVLVERAVVPPPRHHSSVLPGLLDEMLRRARRTPAELAAVVVGLGPGSFTGLRIALATAKGLCYAARVPLLGASSLAAMALEAAPDAAEGELLVPCFDARKGEVYCGFFRKLGSGIREEAAEVAIAPELLVERLAGEGRVHVFGPGRLAYGPLAALPNPGTAVVTPDAFALARLAGAIPAFDARAVFALEPHYVRPSDHEWNIRQKTK